MLHAALQLDSCRPARRTRSHRRSLPGCEAAKQMQGAPGNRLSPAWWMPMGASRRKMRQGSRSRQSCTSSTKASSAPPGTHFGRLSSVQQLRNTFSATPQTNISKVRTDQNQQEHTIVT